MSRKKRSSRKSPSATASSSRRLVAATIRTSTRCDALGAEPLQLPGLERAQQLGLGVRAQVADLVEEEGAAVRQLEPAQPPLGGAGEGAALVAEHLGLDQVARDGGAVDGDERRAPARRLAAWTAAATSSLPVPLSPVSSTRASVGATRAISARTCCMAALSPTRADAAAQLGLERAVLRPGAVELQRGPHRHQHRLRG